MNTELKRKMPSLKVNFIMNAVLTMSSVIFPMITFPYISRVLAAEGIGKVTFATSLVSYFLLFAQLGVPTYGVRTCAVVRDDKDKLTRTVQEIFLINLLMTGVAYIAFFVALYTVPRLQDERLLYIIVGLSILFNTIGMEWLYKALEQYTYITVRSLVFKVIAVLCMFLLIHEKEDYVIYGGVSILASSASYVCNFVHARKIINLRPVGNYQFRRHLKPIFVFFAMSCAITIYTNLDIVMLGFMKSDTVVGYYGAAVKIKNLLLSFVASMGTVLLPRVSYYVEHNQQDEFQAITKKAVFFVLLISVPFTVYFMLFARPSIRFLSGNAFDGAIVPMIIIMPTLIFIGLTNIMGTQTLVPLGQENKVLYSEICGAVVDLILNIILIPKYGAAGAAVGTLAAETVVFLYQYMSLKEFWNSVFRKYNYGRLLLSTGIAGIASYWVHLLNVSNFIMLLFSAVLFFGSYGCMLLWMKDELVTDVVQQCIFKVRDLAKRIH